jgi:SAM-dependent methyltransferase
MKLPFKESSFDFVFYHHVIEHVPNPVATLVEISRLLIPGGALYIGTPNRHRLIGYTGAYKISLGRKIRNNLMDYKYRLLGKFHNEMGAHAGFSKNELEKMLIPYFTDLQWLTEDYLMFKYQQRLHKAVLNILLKPYVLEVAAPSIYVLCRKPAKSETS